MISEVMQSTPGITEATGKQQHGIPLESGLKSLIYILVGFSLDI